MVSWIQDNIVNPPEFYSNIVSRSLLAYTNYQEQVSTSRTGARVQACECFPSYQ